jgi:hypothetical protein
MRTTIRLDDNLLSAVKHYAHETGQTLTAVVESALREILARRTTSVRRAPVKLTTVGGQGLLHGGIDLDDSKVLLEIMEQDRGSA